MNRLYLLRHAKAGWAETGMRDFDRPLDETGLIDADATGIAMRAGGHVPDLTLCSTALRARQTLQGIAAHADTGRVVFYDSLYSEDAAGYLKIIRGHGNAGSILVIGHNPMMEDLAMAIADEGEPGARAALNGGFPTSGLAVIRFEESLTKIEPGTGYLEHLLSPVES